ncbi:MAG: cytochrome c oxidase assembly factor 1 family protein [Flavobacteriaceae bacterium]|nr:cytochrome c oxidase assembly factor 1 family protein [Flavobacteriaceae bacterium]
MEENSKQKNWFGRNWKWSLPTFGCLSIIVGTIVTVFLLYGAIETKVTDMFKDSVPYAVGMKNLRQNELVIEKLGEPVEPNGMFQGSINYEDDNGTADLKIPVKGPKGEATLLVIAEKNGDVWIYQTMKVTFEVDDEIINLLPFLKEAE